MDHYIFVITNNDNTRYSLLWRIEDNIAIRAGVPNAKDHAGCYYEADSPEALLEAMRNGPTASSTIENIEFHKTELAPGEYYPRIARPNDQHWHESPGDNPGESAVKKVIAISLGQLNVLSRQLDHICQVVHPSEATFSTYGHSIRNLLILACTEVETHWRGILSSNGYNKEIYRTNDYVLLLDAMKLNHYAVGFPSFPWLKPIRPFSNWDAKAPTASLSWYSSYNAVKHNREGEFAKGTLEHAFEAVAACAIMMAAQFGLHFTGWSASESSNFFDFEELPKWTPSDVYTFPYDRAYFEKFENLFLPVNYSFNR